MFARILMLKSHPLIMHTNPKHPSRDRGMRKYCENLLMRWFLWLMTS